MVDRAAIPQVSEEELVAPSTMLRAIGGNERKKIGFVGKLPLCGFGKLFQIPFRKPVNHERL